MTAPGGTGDGRAILVRVLKIVLPLVALGIFAALFVVNSSLFNSGVSFDGLGAEGGDGLRLTNPRFTGATKQGEPFLITAAWALPDGPKPQKVDLSEVQGEINLADGRVVTIKAAEGVFLPETRHVSLSGDVTLDTSDGYRLTAARAALDSGAEILTASGGVTARGALGEIAAEEMRATKAPEGGANTGEGAYIWFEKRVKVRIEQPDMAGQGG